MFWALIQQISRAMCVENRVQQQLLCNLYRRGSGRSLCRFRQMCADNWDAPATVEQPLSLRIWALIGHVSRDMCERMCASAIEQISRDMLKMGCTSNCSATPVTEDLGAHFADFTRDVRKIVCITTPVAEDCTLIGIQPGDCMIVLSQRPGVA